MKKLRLALVGCGAAATQCHLPGLSHTEAFEVILLVDPALSHATKLSQAFSRRMGRNPGPEVSDSVRGIAGSVDAAVICSPHSTHSQAAKELIGQGIHCLIEKPLAVSEPECREIGALASRKRVVAGVAHVRRLFPASQWAKGLIRSGRLGTLHKVEWEEGGAYDWPLVTPSLFSKNLSGGGVLFDTGPHVLDLIFWWLEADGAEVIEYSDTSLGGAESESKIHALAGEVSLELRFSRIRGLANKCRITGSQGSVQFGIDLDSEYAISSAAGTVLEKGRVPCQVPARGDWELIFTEQLENFSRAIAKEEAIYAGIEDGARTVRFINQCYEARKAIELPWRVRENVRHG